MGRLPPGRGRALGRDGCGDGAGRATGRKGDRPAVRRDLVPAEDRREVVGHRRGTSRTPAPRRPPKPARRACSPYCSAMHPTATTARVRAPDSGSLRSAASSRASIESFLACWTNPHVLTRATSASAASSTRSQPSAVSRRRASSRRRCGCIRAPPSERHADRRPARPRCDRHAGSLRGADPAPGPRRAQRPALGAAAPGRRRPGPPRHRRAGPDDGDDLPRLRAGASAAVLVRVRAEQLRRPRRHPDLEQVDPVHRLVQGGGADDLAQRRRPTRSRRPWPAASPR